VSAFPSSAGLTSTGPVWLAGPPRFQQQQLIPPERLLCSISVSTGDVRPDISCESPFLFRDMWDRSRLEKALGVPCGEGLWDDTSECKSRQTSAAMLKSVSPHWVAVALANVITSHVSLARNMQRGSAQADSSEDARPDSSSEDEHRALRPTLVRWMNWERPGKDTAGVKARLYSLPRPSGQCRDVSSFSQRDEFAKSVSDSF
jgi:hypothetical protein